MSSPGTTHDEAVERIWRVARKLGWRAEREVTGTLWRMDLMCYRDGACVGFEVEAHTPREVEARQYERLHAGAWCFWFLRTPRAYGFATYSFDDIEARVSALLTAPVPFLPATASPIPRPEPTQDAQRLTTCAVCGFTRRLIGWCWRCAYGGSPYHVPVPSALTTDLRDKHSLGASRAQGVPISGVFADLLAWRDAREMVADPAYDFQRYLILRSERTPFLTRLTKLRTDEIRELARQCPHLWADHHLLQREERFAEIASAKRGLFEGL